MRTDVAVEKLCEIAPILSEFSEKLAKDEEYKKLMSSIKDNTSNKTFIFTILPFFLKNYKKEAFELLAIWSDKSVEDVKAQTIGETVKQIKELFADEDFRAFFSSSDEKKTTSEE